MPGIPSLRFRRYRAAQAHPAVPARPAATRSRGASGRSGRPRSVGHVVRWSSIDLGRPSAVGGAAPARVAPARGPRAPSSPPVEPSAPLGARASSRSRRARSPPAAGHLPVSLPRSWSRPAPPLLRRHELRPCVPGANPVRSSARALPARGPAPSGNQPRGLTDDGRRRRSSSPEPPGVPTSCVLLTTSPFLHRSPGAPPHFPAGGYSPRERRADRIGQPARLVLSSLPLSAVSCRVPTRRVVMRGSHVRQKLPRVAVGSSGVPGPMGLPTPRRDGAVSRGKDSKTPPLPATSVHSHTDTPPQAGDVPPALSRGSTKKPPSSGGPLYTFELSAIPGAARPACTRPGTRTSRSPSVP